MSTQSRQSDKYYLDITPAGWTFSIWGVIYTWQALWILYSLVNLFRKNCYHEPLYASPYVLPSLLFGVYSLANGCSIIWCFLFDRGLIEGALAVIVLTTAFLILALVVSYKAVSGSARDLLEQGRGFEVWLVRVFVHNGLGIYSSWTSIATVLNLAMVIAYTDGSDVSVTAASTTALGILSFEIVVFVLTDVFLLDRYSRYTFTPYLVLVVTLIGSLVKNWDPGARNSIFTAVLCSVGCAALVLKLVITASRRVKEGRMTN